MEEIWKNIKGYEDLYQVSNKGRVKSLKFGKEKIMKFRIGSGYCKLGLNKDKKQKQFRVHRLVAEAFLPNENKFPVVNHKDRNRSNNNVENLEWCTQLDNMIHKIDTLYKYGEFFECLCDKCKNMIKNFPNT